MAHVVAVGGVVLLAIVWIVSSIWQGEPIIWPRSLRRLSKLHPVVFQVLVLAAFLLLTVLAMIVIDVASSEMRSR